MADTVIVAEVFKVAGRVVLAIDEAVLTIRAGDILRSNDVELVVKAVAFASPAAWANGRRGIAVEIIWGNVAPGQTLHFEPSARRT